MARLEKLKTKKSISEPSNLILNGSHITLSNRDISTRELKTKSLLPLTSLPTRRPMSAVPELSSYKVDDINNQKIISRLRPQSADNVPFTKNMKDLISFTSNNNLPSTKLLEKLIKEPVMRSWATTPHNFDTLTSGSSVISEEIPEELEEDDDGEKFESDDVDEDEPLNSEISFGTKIQNLAQKNISPSKDLQPGIKHKPPLPTNKRTEEIIRSNSPKKYALADYNFGDLTKEDSKKRRNTPPPCVSMSKEYQSKYFKDMKPSQFEIAEEKKSLYCTENNTQMQENFQTNTQMKESEKNNTEIHTDEKSNDLAQFGAEFDLYFKQWAENDKNDSFNETIKLKQIRLYEHETDLLLQQLHSQEQQEYSENFEFNKSLSIIDEINSSVANESDCEQADTETLFNNSNNMNKNPIEQIENSSAIMSSVQNEQKSIVPEPKSPVKKSKSPTKFMETKDTQTVSSEFSLREYDERLKKDKDFLSTASFELTIDESENAVATKDHKDINNEKEKIDTSKLEEKHKSSRNHELENGKNEKDTENNKIERPEWTISSTNDEKMKEYKSIFTEQPERDTSSRRRDKIEIVKNVLSAIPSTYEDITTILNFLEHDQKQSEQMNVDHINKWIAEVSEQNFVQNESTTVDEPIKEQNQIVKNFKTIPSKNYSEILTFLEQVDQNCNVILNAAKIRAYSVKQTTENILSGSLPSLEDLLQMNHVDLAHEVIGMRLELEEKNSSIKLLQDTLNEQRAMSQKLLKNTDVEAKKKVKSQKDEYEAVVKRHQKFIDQLINEKKTLNERCESLVKQMKQMEERHASSMKAAEHRFAVEMQRAKEMFAAAEKLRREKWLAGKTEKIKEMTVKGLEPELNNMQQRHQQEINDLRTMHKQEIEELELRASRKTQQQCEALRDQLLRERDEIITKEREAMQQRIQKTIENEEKNYQEQRRQLIAENERIKQRLEAEYAAKFEECEARIEAIEREKERAIEQFKGDYQDRLDAMMRKHKNEINALKETIQIEQETWKITMRKEQTLWQSNKEAEIRAQSKKERDREIELVIERLENESIEMKRQIEQAAENKIKRLTEKFQMEIKYLEESEKQAQKRYLETKDTLINNENDLSYLRGVVKKLETKLTEIEEENKQLLNERQKIHEVIRQELESEMKSLQDEIFKLRNERESEMFDVYKRVKQTVLKKDQTIMKMKQEQTLLVDKCKHLEQLLENQRKTYLLNVK